MWRTLIKSSLGGLIGMMPKWAWYGLVALALLMAGGWINGQRWQVKYQALQTAQAQAIEQAQSKQAALNTQAAEQFQQESQTAQKHYEARTQQIDHYAKTNQNRPNCAVDDDFIRLYNDTSAVTQPSN